MSNAPGYSVVVPIYNDGYLARALCEELARVFAQMGSTFELIFVNDGSRNDSLKQLQALTTEFDFVTVVDLSRNFGQHQAIACGFRLARGERIIRLNVDMQDPPSELPRMIAAMDAGDLDLVVGHYSARQSPLTSKLTSYLYFKIFRFLTGFEVPRNSSAIRVMSRRFIDAYNSLTEKTHFPQGLDAALGFRQHSIEIEHRPRIDGKSSYTFTKRLALALNGILYFSDRPIKLMVGFGFAVACIGVFLGLFIVTSQLLGTHYLPGYASLAAIGLFTFGIQLTCLGVLGLYIGRIFREVQNRPAYIVRETYGRNLA